MHVRAIVGDSGSGKTLLAEHLVAALVDKGQRVAYVKHAPHGFDPGKVGSDTWRVAQAGAAQCLVVGARGQTRVEHPADGSLGPEALMLGGLDADSILLEGFSSTAWPKIRVARRGAAPREVAPPVLHEVVCDEDGFAGAELRAALDSLLASTTQPSAPTVSVSADGQDIPVRGFAARALASTVRGLCTTLHGVHDPAELTISVRWPADEAGPHR